MQDHCTVEYRDIPGFPGYRVGSDGSVWSCLKRGSESGIMTPNWRLLKQDTEKKSGYKTARLSLAGRKKNMRVHVIVLRSFVGPKPNGMMCCHEDDDPANNAIANLRWDTQRGNSKDAIRNSRTTTGEKNASACLTTEKVSEIRRRAANGEDSSLLAVEFGVDYSHLRGIIRGRFWKDD